MDISSRKDLYQIVQLFYEKLLKDEQLKMFFVAFSQDELLLNEHLLVLVDFWDGILFSSNTYHKNAMKPHIEKNKSISFTKAHFKQWLYLFHQSVDALFSGLNATLIKNRAQSIAMVMELKILNNK